MENHWSEGQSQDVQYTPCIDLSGGDYNGEQQVAPTVPDVLPNPAARVPPRNRRKDKQKGVAKRSGNYTGAEDELLCSAYLNVSKDAIVGINQPLMCYWQRVLQYFNKNKKTPIQRTSSSLQHRWGEIQKDTAQFCSYYGEIESKNQSGKCEDDKIKDAFQLYEGVEKRPFKYLHCWLILRREQKWLEDLAPKSKESKAPNSPAEPSEQTAAPTEDVEGGYVRPIGRDKAKKQRSGRSVNSQSTACLEVLQKIQSDRAKLNHKCKKHQRMSPRKLLRELRPNLPFKGSKSTFKGNRWPFNKSRWPFPKSGLIFKRRCWTCMRRRIDHIITIDVDKMAPWVRDYYIKEQKEIAATKAQGPEAE